MSTAIASIDKRNHTPVNPQYQSALSAVAQQGLALKNYPDLCDDMTIVSAAVQQNGLALQFASDNLRHDRELVKLAAKNNPQAFVFAHHDLQNQDTRFQSAGRLLIPKLHHGLRLVVGSIAGIICLLAGLILFIINPPAFGLTFFAFYTLVALVLFSKVQYVFNKQKLDAITRLNRESLLK